MVHNRVMPFLCVASKGRAERTERNSNIVERESIWRRPGIALDRSSPPSPIAVSRWFSMTSSVNEAATDTSKDHFVAKIVLRSMDIHFSCDGRSSQDGQVTPGSVHVANPSSHVSCLFRGPYDCLHLHIPTNMMVECGRRGLTSSTAGFEYPNAFLQDSSIGQLCRALLGADEIGADLGLLYVDHLALALTTRIVALFQRHNGNHSTRASGLAKWRLKRAMDYIDARFAEPIRLADIAAAAGLTRMYFAAQFRESTGLRPHEYLLRRRVERAQTMLAEKDASLVNVALSVGFESQSHFTSVFKRYVGQPPNAWRQSVCPGLRPERRTA